MRIGDRLKSWTVLRAAAVMLLLMGGFAVGLATVSNSAAEEHRGGGGKKGAAKGAPKARQAPKRAQTGTKSERRSGPKNSAASSGNPKGFNPKGRTGFNPKGGGQNGANSKAANRGLPKGGNPQGNNNRFGNNNNNRFGNVNRNNNRAAQRQTLAGRQRLRADHRRELVAIRNRLPARPLPGQRGFTGVPPAGERRFRDTEMVFQVGPNVSQQAVNAAAQRLGLTTIATQSSSLAGGTVYHFRLGAGRQVAQVVQALENERIGVAQPNYVYQLSQGAEPAGAAHAGQSDQYIINKLQLAEVHKVATGSNVLIAVIDSQIDAKHPDLAGAVVDQFDAVGRPEKPHVHGTGMAGAIVAHLRLMGIAPGAKILAVHAFSTEQRQTAEATTQHILAGLDWAIAKGARVINMSFAGPYDPMLALAMKNAHDKGVVLVAATGNAGPKSPPLYPAADPNVIGVTATDENDKVFDQANQGPQVAIAAPGVDIVAPAPDATYQVTTGTSVAAAHVSGVAALLIGRHPEVNAQTILEVLTDSARKVDGNDRDDQYGWGLIDPETALAELDARLADGKVATSGKSSEPTPASFSAR